MIDEMRYYLTIIGTIGDWPYEKGFYHHCQHNQNIETDEEIKVYDKFNQLFEEGE